MLVLAIAAVIIVMSVRYYQSASAAQRANACLSYLQAVAAAADSLSEATQSYKDIGADAIEISKQIDAIVPRNEAVCSDPKYGTVDSSEASYIGFSIYLPKPACQLMIPALKVSGHWYDPYHKLIDESDCQFISRIGQGYGIVYYRTKL